MRSPIQHHLVLHQIDPEQGIRRFYSLTIERDLFGTIRLVLISILRLQEPAHKSAIMEPIAASYGLFTLAVG